MASPAALESFPAAKPGVGAERPMATESRRPQRPCPRKPARNRCADLSMAGILAQPAEAPQPKGRMRSQGLRALCSGRLQPAQQIEQGENGQNDQNRPEPDPFPDWRLKNTRRPNLRRREMIKRPLDPSD